jgi:uncharacterized membrane protein
MRFYQDAGIIKFYQVKRRGRSSFAGVDFLQENMQYTTFSVDMIKSKWYCFVTHKTLLLHQELYSKPN